MSNEPDLTITREEIVGCNDPNAAKVQMKSTLVVALAVEQAAGVVARTGVMLSGTMIACAMFLKWC